MTIVQDGQIHKQNMAETAGRPDPLGNLSFVGAGQSATATNTTTSASQGAVTETAQAATDQIAANNAQAEAAQAAEAANVQATADQAKNGGSLTDGLTGTSTTAVQTGADGAGEATVEGSTNSGDATTTAAANTGAAQEPQETESQRILRERKQEAQRSRTAELDKREADLKAREQELNSKQASIEKMYGSKVLVATMANLALGYDEDAALRGALAAEGKLLPGVQQEAPKPQPGTIEHDLLGPEALGIDPTNDGDAYLEAIRRQNVAKATKAGEEAADRRIAQFRAEEAAKAKEAEEKQSRLNQAAQEAQTINQINNSKLKMLEPLLQYHRNLDVRQLTPESFAIVQAQVSATAVELGMTPEYLAKNILTEDQVATLAKAVELDPNKLRLKVANQTTGAQGGNAQGSNAQSGNAMGANGQPNPTTVPQPDNQSTRFMNRPITPGGQSADTGNNPLQATEAKIPTAQELKAQYLESIHWK